MAVAVLLLGIATLIEAGWAARAVAQAPSRAPATPQPGAVAASIAGRAITLEEALAIALENQPQILARLYDYAAARFRVDQALSPLLPQLTGTVSATRLETTTIPAATSGGSGATSRHFSDTFLGQVALSQLLFDFGKNAASLDASRKLAQVALEDVELQRQLITLAVKEAYTNTLFAQRLIRVQRQALERAQLNLRSARGFFEVGTRPKSDVSRAEVDVANARVDTIRASNAERLARVALNTAMGLPAETPTEIVDNLVYATVTLDRAQLLPEALRQRPEYRQAKLRIENAESTMKRTFRDFFPDIVGTGAYGGVSSDLHESWSLGLSLNWSIFDGGNRIAKYREARANVDAAQARLKATELDISREVEQAQLIVAESDERIQAAQTAVASAQENFRLAQGRFDAGVGTILELTDAQLALTQAQNGEALALADFRIALARLDRALGRR
jgi:outer membrane protein TolC